jgi:hypothetical protein
MGEISRAHDRVYDVIGTWEGEEFDRVEEALNGIYQVGFRHGEAEYEARHADDEPVWVEGARALKLAGGDDKAIGSYVKHFL